MHEIKLLEEDIRLLLQLARVTISEYLKGNKGVGGQLPEVLPSLLKGREVPELLLVEAGAFVTLHIEGRLRGCIGLFESNEPLYKTVQEMAISAATRDPRFTPLETGELEVADIEISVLSPLIHVANPEEITIGRDGLYIIKDNYRGVLLPQVAVEHNFDRETFLDETCLKAGLPKGTWRDNNTQILRFTAQVFGDKGLAA